MDIKIEEVLDMYIWHAVNWFATWWKIHGEDIMYNASRVLAYMFIMR